VADDTREHTGSHRANIIETHEGRLVALETARDIWKQIIGGVAGLALTLSISVGGYTITQNQTAAIERAELRRRMESVESRLDRMEVSRDVIGTQLGAIAVELGALRVSVDAFGTRMERLEERIDASPRR
jgi:hypothetical protein